MKRQLLFKKLLIINCVLLITAPGFAQIDKSAKKYLLDDSVISTGHIGISVYDPSANTYLYNYNATKNFIPSSNVKLFTLYAGMKYLGDSLAGIKYKLVKEGNDSIPLVYPTGDPTFLHPEFKQQVVFSFLKQFKDIILNNVTGPSLWGKGWAWDDYKESYMASRYSFPIYGNCIWVKWINKDSIGLTPSYFLKNVIYKNPDLQNGFDVLKLIDNNDLTFIKGNNKTIEIPINFTLAIGKDLLQDTLKSNIHTTYAISNYRFPKLITDSNLEKRPLRIIHSQPCDSLFKPMMHRSDNFFAEQTLLMVSNERLGYMNDEAIIDSLLKNDLKDIPQQPRWVDGSGLSRYNLFTPQSFVYILAKMKAEFGWERMKVILPTGGEGTLKSYYIKDSGSIYAKTGSMSNNNALSGYITTKKGKQLIFSILVNNFQGSGSSVRHSIESFIEDIIKNY